ncbi:hypothetical protein [Mesorhizobium sp. M0220]|uniref:glycosyltransferase family 9 protein n=1 Tax=Mesorhizobium sp. M0220 TaxID=2956920 RepID=UPI003335E8A5
MVRALRRFRFDLTIDLADSKTSRVIVRLVNTKTRVGYDPPEKPLRWLESQAANVAAKPFGFGGPYYLYRYLSPLEALGVELRAQVLTMRPLPLETGKAASPVVTSSGPCRLQRFWRSSDRHACFSGTRVARCTWPPPRERRLSAFSA